MLKMLLCPISVCIRSIQLATRVSAGDPVKQSNNQYWLVASFTTNIPGIVSVNFSKQISSRDLSGCIFDLETIILFNNIPVLDAEVS